jgi:hypothetical protein
MLEGFTYTDWLLITVLWFQVANLLFQLWPKLSRLRHHGEVEVRAQERAKGKDAYETLFGGEENKS